MYPQVDKGATPLLKVTEGGPRVDKSKTGDASPWRVTTLVEGRSLVSLDLVKAKVLRSDLFSLYSL